MRMYYIETSVLISYVFASDIGHSASERILEKLVFEKQRLFSSSFTLIEMYNTICRKIVKEEKLGLVDPLQRYVNIYKGSEEQSRFLLSLIIGFLKEKLNIEFIDKEDFYDFVSMDFDKLRLPKIFKESMDLSPKLTVRIKDLLHLIYAYMFSKTYNIKYFLTRDIENFEKIKNIVKQMLQIDVVLIR